MKPILAVGAIINGIVLLQFGVGLLNALLPLRMRDAGFTSSDIGVMVAGFSAGFLLGCIYAPHLIHRIGHIRTFSAFATVLSTLTLALAIDTDLMLWTAARLLSGFCYAGLLTVSDSWISGETERSVRGRVMSVYMILYKLAQAGGPLILTLAVIDGNWHFMLVSALFSMSLLPIAMRHGDNPTPPSNERMGLIKLYKITPLAVVGCLCIGTTNSGTMNLITLYGIDIGLDRAGAVMLSSALQLGALFLQWPLGWASDKRDRRTVMIFGVGGLVLVSTALVLAPTLPLWGYLILVGMVGGFGLSIYPIIISHAGDFVKPDQMVPLCATLMLAFAFGMTLGPLTGSAAMEVFGPSGLFMHSIFFGSVFIVFALYRMTRRRAPVNADRMPYVNMPASSAIVSQIDPRTEHPEIDESLEEAFGHDPRDPNAGEEIPHYSPSSK